LPHAQTLCYVRVVKDARGRGAEQGKGHKWSRGGIACWMKGKEDAGRADAQLGYPKNSEPYPKPLPLS